jgi:hypothetical protein
VLAKFARLIFHGHACRLAARLRAKQLHAGLEGSVISDDFQEAAILKIGLSVDSGDCKFVLPQGCTQIVTHIRLHEELNHPETGSQEERERKKADEKCSRLKAHRYLLPVLATAEAFTGPANSESWPIGMKKFATESCPASTTIVLRKNPAVLCHATMVYLPGDTSGMRYCPARSALGTSDSE